MSILIAGSDPADFDHTYSVTGLATYVERLFPATQDATINKIIAAVKPSNSQSIAWQVGHGELDGTEITVKPGYGTIDVWAGAGESTALQIRTFTAPDDFTAFDILEGEYIVFESRTTGEPFTAVGRTNTPTTRGYRYTTNNDLIPDEIGNPIVTTNSTAAVLEIGYWADEASAGIAVINNVNVANIAKINGVSYANIAKINGVTK